MERYYVEKGNYGYVIRDSEKLLPLPFFYISIHNANRDCEKFNKFGTDAIMEEYYIHKIAGKGSGITYKKWKEENKHLFE